MRFFSDAEIGGGLAPRMGLGAKFAIVALTAEVWMDLTMEL